MTSPTYEELEKLTLTEPELLEYDYICDIPKDDPVPFVVSMNDKKVVCVSCDKHFSIHDNNPNSSLFRYTGGFFNQILEKNGSERRVGSDCINRGAHLYKLYTATELHSAIPFSIVGNLAKNSPNGKSIVGISVDQVYTSYGMEAGKITLIDFYTREILFEKCIRTQGLMLYPNTKLTGLVEDDFFGPECLTFEKARKEILDKFIFADTILVGHLVDSHLKALRLIHTKIIDTAFLFPFKGRRIERRSKLLLKKKYALKYVAEEILERHFKPGMFDSCKNTNVAMDLVLAYLEGKKL